TRWWRSMYLRRNRFVVTQLKLVCIAVAFLLLALAACGSETAPAASDPPGALVRLQQNDAAATLPGDFTVFSSGSLQLYLGDRGALRKTVAVADLSGLETALADSALDTLANTYPATLPTNADGTLTIYGAHRRMVRYNPGSLDLSPALQRLIQEVMV